MKKKKIIREGISIIYTIAFCLGLYYSYKYNLVEQHKTLYFFLYFGVLGWGGFSLLKWYRKK